MNAKELLTLLEEDFSDKNVASAIAWLKTKKPSNKAANQVLLKILFHQQTQSESNWLRSRLAETDLELFEYSSSGIKTHEHLEFMLKLLQQNIERPDAGFLWGELLREFRHKDLEPGALRWLKLAKPGNTTINSVLRELLRLSPDPSLVDQAKEILQKQFDPLLLVSLIEHCGDEELYNAGREFLKGEESKFLKLIVAHALAGSNIQANRDAVSLFLLDKKNQSIASHFFSFLDGEQKSQIFEFTCEWIAINRSTNLAKERLTKPLFVLPQHENAARLWSWFIKGAQNEDRFEVLVRMFDNSWCPLNNEAREYITTWILKNPKHKLKKYAQAALDRTAKKAFKTVYGTYISKEELREQNETNTAQESEKIRKATIDEWLEKHEKSRDQIQTIFHVFQSTKKPEEFSTLIYNLDRHNIPLEVFLGSQSVSMSRDEFLDIAKKAIENKQLLRRWNYAVHLNIGTLILECLRISPSNETLFEYAKDWLAIRPKEHEIEVFEELKKIVKAHEKDSA